MCVCFLAVQARSDYPLILLHNRDEYYERAALPLQWQNNASAMYGLDLKSGGTWLGLHCRGLFACITNYRDPQLFEKNRISRGHIIPQIFSMQRENLEAIKNFIAHEQPKYNHFNLILGFKSDVWFFDSRTQVWQLIERGWHGLSNAGLNTAWPKVKNGKEIFREILAEEQFAKKKLFDLMQSSNLADDSELPSTGIPLEFERLLSAIFVKTPVYGTRCSSLILFGADGSVSFDELTYNKEGELVHSTSLSC